MNQPTIESLLEENKQLKECIEIWQRAKTFHYCYHNDKWGIKPYPHVLCSCCHPSTKDVDFDPIEKINQLMEKLNGR